MQRTAKIYIAGYRGMVGSGLERKLRKEGYNNIVTRTSSELDLRSQEAVNDFFEKEKPEYVIIAAAKVGGIHANNTYRAEFIYDNLMIEANIIHSAYLNKVTKLLFLGSSCIYPKMAPQPLKEEYLLTGPLEETNQWYAIAKISGIKLIEALRKQYSRDYVSLMPTNLYGPGDNYDHETSHVLPAMIRKFHEAKLDNHSVVNLWGTGTPKREFLHVDDLAQAVLFSIENTLEISLYNVGSGKEVSIKELAHLIQEIVGHNGEIIWDSSKPDGTPRKLMDSDLINSKGWKSNTDLVEGIKKTYKDFLSF